MTQAGLFFGGSPAAAQWQAFVDQEITPRFPDGFSVLETQGQWRDGAGVISREAGHELLVVIAPSPDAQTKLNAIRDAYKRRFTQESVLLVESPVCAAF